MRPLREIAFILTAALLGVGLFLTGGRPAQAEGMNLVIQGEAFPVEARLLRAEGIDPRSVGLEFSLMPEDAGLVTREGRVVLYRPGEAVLGVSEAGRMVRFPLEVLPRRIPEGDFVQVFEAAPRERFTSDLWAQGDLLLTGTWQGRFPPGDTRLPGDRMLLWDVGNPENPRLFDEFLLDARTVNDVKIRADGKLAAASHEGSEDGLNGISLFDVSDPFDPLLLTRFTQELEPGVHNLWMEDDFLYAVVDGEGAGLRILDISEPASPRIVGRFAAETSFLHDVLVRDGLAFLSHWDAGLIILDVGNGLAGGSPENPVELSRLPDLGGQTHNAWYWPEADLLFVGERDHVTPGVLHVLDVSDLFGPREVATFAVPGDTPHNFWLDEGRGILYAAWYSEGLLAIDVTGSLLGELEKQGRTIARARYGSEEGCLSASGTCTWAPQLHKGHVFLTDMNTGLRVFRPEF